MTERGLQQMADAITQMEEVIQEEQENLVKAANAIDAVEERKRHYWNKKHNTFHCNKSKSVDIYFNTDDCYDCEGNFDEERLEDAFYSGEYVPEDW